MTDPGRLFNPNHNPPDGWHYARHQDGWVLEPDTVRVHDWPSRSAGRVRSILGDGCAVSVVLLIIWLLVKLAGA